MPNSISDNLQRLQTARTGIANAITAKGGTVGSNDGFEEFISDIGTIPDSVETYCQLFVTTESGVTITVSKGGTTLDPQTCVGGEELVFNIPESGTWTVSGSNNITKTVSIINQVSYYIEIVTVHTFGVLWNKTTSTVLTRTDDSANFSNPNPYYKKMSGTPSSPFDNYSPWKDIAVETIEGNSMVKIPKYWYKITSDSNGLKIQISDRAQDGFSISPAHQDRKDGEGERDYVYIGRYVCNSTNYKSTTNSSPKGSVSITTFREQCKKQGSDQVIPGFYQQDFAMFWTIRMLYLVEFANWDSQACIGFGCYYYQTSGTTDSMTYHTGTTETSRSTYGDGTQYRHIENMWTCIDEFCDGIFFSGTNNVDVYIVKNPLLFTNSDKTYAANVGQRATSNGCISDFLVPSVNGYDWVLYPSAVNGTDYTKYISDKSEYDSDGSALQIGGSMRDRSGGLFYMDAASSSSVISSRIGSRLMYLPPNS